MTRTYYFYLSNDMKLNFGIQSHWAIAIRMEGKDFRYHQCRHPVPPYDDVITPNWLKKLYNLVKNLPILIIFQWISTIENLNFPSAPASSSEIFCKLDLGKVRKFSCHLLLVKKFHGAMGQILYPRSSKVNIATQVSIRYFNIFLYIHIFFFIPIPGDIARNEYPARILLITCFSILLRIFVFQDNCIQNKSSNFVIKINLFMHWCVSQCHYFTNCTGWSYTLAPPSRAKLKVTHEKYCTSPWNTTSWDLMAKISALYSKVLKTCDHNEMPTNIRYFLS